MSRTPPIGVPRIYAGETVPVIYPGEVAQARISSDAIVAALQRGDRKIAITEWTVEPTPGWHGRWLRLRYRAWGQWLWRARPPKLTVSMDAAQVQKERQ